MPGKLRQHWPMGLTIVVLGLLTAGVLAASMQRTGGRLVYVLDDVYIHMAIAKSFAQDGVWGVTRHEFSSSASSLIWPILLAISYRLFGPNEISPFILNVIFSVMLIVFLYAVFRKRSLPIVYACVSLLLVLILMPLLALLFGGQEHIFHCLVTMVFVYAAAVVLAAGKGHASRLSAVALCLLAPVVTLARYEGLFAAVVVCGLLVVQKRWWFALLLGVLAIAPAGIFAAISVSQGWYVLPNPVLLKSQWAPATHAAPGPGWVAIVLELLRPVVYDRLMANPHLLFLVLTALLMFVLRFGRQTQTWDVGQIMIAIFVATTVVHLQLARTGWFYRYEAYLVSLGLFVVTWTGYDGFAAALKPPEKLTARLPVYLAWLGLLIFPLWSLSKRALEATSNVPQAAENIYEQQYHMARFVREFYDGATVAANDVGAINYMADLRCVDLGGLASIEVARRMQARRFDTQAIREICAASQVQIAMVYDQWYLGFGGLPSEWAKVGSWSIRDNVVCGGTTVSFYAVDPQEKDHLRASLRAFAPRLPRDVIQAGTYLN